MKKKYIYIIGTIILLIALGVGGYFYFRDKEEIKPNNGSIEEVVKDITKEEQNNLVISNLNIREYGATNIVSGKVENKKNSKRNVKLTLKMTNTKNGKALGLNYITIELAGKETKDFEIGIMGDYTTVDNFEILTEDIK